MSAGDSEKRKTVKAEALKMRAGEREGEGGVEAVSEAGNRGMFGGGVSRWC